eukprot:COSAG02_NODE_237_length_27732_cov_9.584374_10_plen_141_part_00
MFLVWRSRSRPPAREVFPYIFTIIQTGEFAFDKLVLTGLLHHANIRVCVKHRSPEGGLATRFRPFRAGAAAGIAGCMAGRFVGDFRVKFLWINPERRSILYVHTRRDWIFYATMHSESDSRVYSDIIVHSDAWLYSKRES